MAKNLKYRRYIDGCFINDQRSRMRFPSRAIIRARRYERRKGKPVPKSIAGLPDAVSAEKCSDVCIRYADGGRGRGKDTQVASTDLWKRCLLARARARARKVNVFPAVNTRRAERRPGVGRLVTWSTVNDRESASRMRRYAADPDARNVIAARPFPSILGDPRGPPRGRPAADPHRCYYCSRRHSPRGRRCMRSCSFALCVPRDSLLRRPPPPSLLFPALFLFFFFFFLNFSTLTVSARNTST